MPASKQTAKTAPSKAEPPATADADVLKIQVCKVCRRPGVGDACVHCGHRRS